MRPRWGSPSSQPCAPSKFITQVAEPWMPILCSIEPQRTALASPATPSRPVLRLGTMKSEMPLVPAGASGRRASTRWTMLSVRSWSPPVMKILVPVTAKLPSSWGSARVLSRPRSEPQWGSVRHIVAHHSPLTMRLRNTSFCQSLPKCLSASIEPCESSG